MLRIVQSTPYMIHATITTEDNYRDMICLYGQPRRQLRKCLWELYTSLLYGITNPLLYFGDFNNLLHSVDKWGGLQVKVHHTSNLRKFTNHLGPLDLGYTGPAFTWTNNQSMRTHFRERLDRAFSTPNW